MTVNDQGLQALASLLESESERAVAMMMEHMRSFSDAQLLRLGTLAAPNSAAQLHIDTLLAERQAPRLQAEFLAWIDAGAELEDGMLLVARAGYPRLQTSAIRRKLDALADEIRPEMTGAPRQRLAVLSQFLHERQGFHGNVDLYYDPDNSYLNRVLEQRTGLPISLTVLYMLLGARLNLPVQGIPLPSHFVGMLAHAPGSVFFDPFNDGRSLTLSEIAGIVNQAGQVFGSELLRPATSRQIIARVLQNLVHGYQERDEPERASLMRRYRSALA